MGTESRKLQLIGRFASGTPDLSQNDPTADGYVKGRTHWKETAQVPLNIEWDGEIGDRVTTPVYDLDDGNVVQWVKLHDAFLSVEELGQCVITYTIYPDGSSVSESLTEIGIDPSDGVIWCDMLLVSVSDPAAAIESSEGIEFPESGLYFMKIDGQVCCSAITSDTVKIPCPVYHPLGKEYLPEELFVKASLAETDPNNAGYIEGLERTVIEGYDVIPETTFTIRTSALEATQTLESGETYVVIHNGLEYEYVCKVFTEFSADLVVLGNKMVAKTVLGLNTSTVSDTGEPFCIVAIRNGSDVCLLDNTGEEVTIQVKKADTVTTKIPTEYLPEIPTVVSLTQAEYDALVEAGTVNDSALYVIVG